MKKIATQFEREEALSLLGSWAKKRPGERSVTEYKLPDNTIAFRVEERAGGKRRTLSLLRMFLTREHAKLAIDALEGSL